MPRKATIKDIAAKAGVSCALVSMHLNKHPLSARIAGATKKRIDLAVAELDYKASYAARALSSGRSGTLGLLLGSLANPYFARFAETALAEASARGRQMLVSLGFWRAEEERRCVEGFADGKVDGVLCYTGLTPENGLALEEKLRRQGVPLVLIEQESDVFPWVRNDCAEAMELAVETLAELGHREITGVFGRSSKKLSDFEAACAKHGVKADLETAELPDASSRLRVARKIVANRPKAIMVNGHITPSILFAEAGKAKPEYKPDVVVSCGYMDSFLLAPGVRGAVLCRTEKLAKMAVGKLIDAVEGRLDGEAGGLVEAAFLTRSEIEASTPENPNDAF
jgi:LacI family transcriptional regulator